MNHREPRKNDERGHVVNANVVAASHKMDTWIVIFEVTFNNISSLFSNHSRLRNSNRKHNFMFYYILDAQPFLASSFLPHREQSNSSINGNKEWHTPRVSRCQWSEPYPLIFLISCEGTRFTILDNATIPFFSLYFMVPQRHINLLLFCYYDAKISDNIIGSYFHILILGLLSVERRWQSILLSS